MRDLEHYSKISTGLTNGESQPENKNISSLWKFEESKSSICFHSHEKTMLCLQNSH